MNQIHLQSAVLSWLFCREIIALHNTADSKPHTITFETQDTSIVLHGMTVNWSNLLDCARNHLILYVFQLLFIFSRGLLY